MMAIKVTNNFHVITNPGTLMEEGGRVVGLFLTMLKFYWRCDFEFSSA